MVLVDSSIWIEATRRQGDLLCKVALAALLEEYEAAACSPVLLEVLGGARKEERKRMQEDFSVVPHIQAGPKDWAAAIENAWKLRDHGHALPWNDVLIGTIGLRRQLCVYSIDKHFFVMRDILGLVLYTPGYGGTYNPN
jgi:predicted nucleic acid-binding protein